MTKLPSWEGFMVPVLRVLSDEVPRHRRDLMTDVADALQLSLDQRRELLNSGEAIYQNRIGWALSYLTNIGALERPVRAHYVITAAGHQLLLDLPESPREADVNILIAKPGSLLRPYASTVRSRESDAEDGSEAVLDATAPQPALTPHEQVQAGIARNHADVSALMLTYLQGQHPAFFERAVVELLLAMGYGGEGGRGTVTQLSNDGGIDGVIDQDVLGLSQVYVQAKRYASTNAVGRPEVQSFVGALVGRGADRGVFLTTSRFTKEAVEYVGSIQHRVILIDGERLTKLMIAHEVGVQTLETHRIVEVDGDFFA